MRIHKMMLLINFNRLWNRVVLPIPHSIVKHLLVFCPQHPHECIEHQNWQQRLQFVFGHSACVRCSKHHFLPQRKSCFLGQAKYFMLKIYNPQIGRAFVLWQFIAHLVTPSDYDHLKHLIHRAVSMHSSNNCMHMYLTLWPRHNISCGKELIQSSLCNENVFSSKKFASHCAYKFYSFLCISI